jgi:serine/threonine protein kinase
MILFYLKMMSKIADFGISKKEDSKKTSYYMSPEVWKDIDSSNQSVDIYSAIISFYIKYMKKEFNFYLLFK